MSAWQRLRASGHITTGVEIRALTTYRLGGPAHWFCEAASVDMLEEVAGAATERGVDFVVLGRGSNLVVSDEGYAGLVIRLGQDFKQLHVDRQASLVTAGAAVSLPLLSRHVALDELAGLEFYIGIPGTVGGAVRMNAGFYGVETADVLHSASVLDASRGSVNERRVDDLGLGYRTSNLGARDVVLDATFRVRPGAAERISALRREAIRWRRDNQPGGTLNAGSVFRNPPGDAAGRIIDSLGLKGMRRGGAHVSVRHANFFVADPGATSQDVYDLVRAVHALVRDRTGIVLEPEVQFVGRFRRASGAAT